MPDTPGAAPVPDKEDERDENDPGEVGGTFATKGLGWSGREGQDEAASRRPDPTAASEQHRRAQPPTG